LTEGAGFHTPEDLLEGCAEGLVDGCADGVAGPPVAETVAVGGTSGTVCSLDDVVPSAGTSSAFTGEGRIEALPGIGGDV
jgi:hypothetical protein